MDKTICTTPEQFHEECEKWAKKGARPVVRGRRLCAYGEVVAELQNTHGGSRPNAGRPKQEGSRHMYTVADDAHEYIMAHGGGQYITNIVRKERGN